MVTIAVSYLIELFYKSDIVKSKALFLMLWTGVNPDCSPIVSTIKLCNLSLSKEDDLKYILIGINEKALILQMEDQDGNVYKILNAIDYANKTCEV